MDSIAARGLFQLKQKAGWICHEAVQMPLPGNGSVSSDKMLRRNVVNDCQRRNIQVITFLVEGLGGNAIPARVIHTVEANFL